MDTFLVRDCEGMATDISLTRKRSSDSCPSRQSAVIEGLSASAILPSAIADLIFKKGFPHKLPEKPTDTARDMPPLGECGDMPPLDYGDGDDMPPLDDYGDDMPPLGDDDGGDMPPLDDDGGDMRYAPAA